MTRRLPVPHYRQTTTDHACGPVCICMAIDFLLIGARRPKLDYVGIKEIEWLTMGCRLWSSKGTNYTHMKHAIRRSGCGCREIGGGTDHARRRELRRVIGAGHPVILGCIAEIGGHRYPHYVVLTGIDSEYIYIRDPFPKGRPSRVLVTDFEKNGNPTSWGNRRWAVKVYLKTKRRA